MTGKGRSSYTRGDGPKHLQPQLGPARLGRSPIGNQPRTSFPTPPCSCGESLRGSAIVESMVPVGPPLEFAEVDLSAMVPLRRRVCAERVVGSIPRRIAPLLSATDRRALTDELCGRDEGVSGAGRGGACELGAEPAVVSRLSKQEEQGP
ncbi:hypothetical protein BKA70DRAFT_1231604 [Coprinopsis sp. MPI-PUGE-AT-0042]|nr:hypothetical protein BKA70DRAFT_1239251 [Coprinopsis sp. MPI-PUGE-AT-0042]KAH6896366.1 hypothetical protein BKA70DRAFT_1231604 [Coprinopsis sp. MPI-PUGE-AT-0042]